LLQNWCDKEHDVLKAHMHTFSRAICLSFSLIALTFCVSACESKCINERECQDSDVCLDGVCSAVSCENRACPAPLVCLPTGACEAPEEVVQCTLNSDCQGGSCVDGFCLRLNSNGRVPSGEPGVVRASPTSI